jgi:hypothetical protein
MVAFLTDWSGLLPITPSGQTGYARLADVRRVIPEHAELVGLAVPHRLMLGDQAAGRLSVLDAPAWADLEHDDQRVMVEPDQHTPVAGAQAGLGQLVSMTRCATNGTGGGHQLLASLARGTVDLQLLSMLPHPAPQARSSNGRRPATAAGSGLVRRRRQAKP